jgi:hypothetical protein
VLNIAAAKGPRWWFLEVMARGTVLAGADAIDLSDDVRLLGPVYCPKRLARATLNQMVALRAETTPNAVSRNPTPVRYAVEARRRIHLFPEPAADTDFTVLYTREMSVAIVPDEWETLILQGVLGYFGQHFDRDALTQTPEEFKADFLAGLRAANQVSRDILAFKSWDDSKVMPA